MAYSGSYQEAALPVVLARTGLSVMLARRPARPS